ncbi:MAG: hypothetical protein AAGH90_05705 [Pseudomonadota bacterium]
MSHTYPIAVSAKQALEDCGLCAATRYDAEALSGEHEIIALETEWLTPPAPARAGILKQITNHSAKGFVATYEDADGATVFAITYWKLSQSTSQKSKPKQRSKTIAKPVKAKSKRKARKRYVDPNQLDLFNNEPNP